jgi:hypothetical protein
MANELTTGLVPIVLDRPRSLRFGVNALSLADPLLKTEFTQIIKDRRMGIGDLRILLWASLKWEDDRLTLDQVGDLMEDAAIADPDFFSSAVEKVFHAVGACRLFKARADSGNLKAEAMSAASASANGSTAQSDQPTAP